MKVIFLDVAIKIMNGRLSTGLYSQRICSERKDLNSCVKDLKGWLLRRGILIE